MAGRAHNTVARKIVVSVPMTPRQVRVVEREARRQEITLPDFVRRIVDAYIDQQGLEQPEQPTPTHQASFNFAGRQTA